MTYVRCHRRLPMWAMWDHLDTAAAPALCLRPKKKSFLRQFIFCWPKLVTICWPTSPHIDPSQPSRLIVQTDKHAVKCQPRGRLLQEISHHNTRQQVYSQAQTRVIAHRLLMSLWGLDAEPCSPLRAANTVLATGMLLNGERTGSLYFCTSSPLMLRSEPMQVLF